MEEQQLMTNGYLYLIDYNEKSFQEIGIAINFHFDNYEEILRPYCDQYIEQLKADKLIFLAAKNEDGELEARFRASYLGDLEEAVFSNFPYYFDVAEHEERFIFGRIVNGEEWEENPIPKPLIDLAYKVFDKAKFTINDWDLDRVYITKGRHEYTIRMWNIDGDKIKWTLFKDIPDEDGGSHGEEQKHGIFHYQVVEEQIQ
jgi:hypothetical protein